MAYNNITGATIGFLTDLIIRAVGGLLLLSNPAVDFVLYLVQMKDFRVFLKINCSSRDVVSTIELQLREIT